MTLDDIKRVFLDAINGWLLASDHSRPDLLASTLAARVREWLEQERTRDGMLLTCPWCGESQAGRIAEAQMSHLIACGDRNVARNATLCDSNRALRSPEGGAGVKRFALIIIVAFVAVAAFWIGREWAKTEQVTTINIPTINIPLEGHFIFQSESCASRPAPQNCT